MNHVSVIAAGDVFMTRRLPGVPYPGERALEELLAGFDVRFANLELTVHDREGYPGAVSGGTWSMAHPRILDDLKRIGFNVYNAAQNHSLDYSHNGMLATMRHLNERDMLFAGIGENLADAAAPVYIETPHARVALICCVSSCPDFWRAGQQRMDMQGRPGVNALRFKTRYHVTHDQLEALKGMAGPLYINAAHDASVRTGFAMPDEGFWRFGSLEFEEDERTFTETRPHPADLERILASIREAKSQADYVLVSFHGHENEEGDNERPAQFLRTFSRACIDGGAAAILGHGPHILRGIEMYHGGVIFYSLGNFLFENDTTTHQPSDFYEKYGMPVNSTAGQGMDKRSKNNTIGLASNPKVYESVLPGVTFEDGKLTSVTLYPVEMGFNLPRYSKGLPALTDDTTALERLKKLSEPFGTEIVSDEGEWKVVIP